MEKKTIGKFISALRRANGMTQKELGEKLYVSDKTVSRWECDECTPELSLIPLIAEIFDITTDELLRGERNKTQNEEQSEKQKEKSEKQFKLMLHNSKKKYGNLSLISIGITMVGLIVAVICNIGFNRGLLGFCLGSIFFIAGVICQICFTVNSRFLIDEDESDYIEILKKANTDSTMKCIKIMFFVAMVWAFCLPIAIFTPNGYYGLAFKSWLIYGVLFILVGFVLCYLVYMLFFIKILTAKKIVFLDSNKIEQLNANDKLMKRILIVFISVFLVIMIISYILNVVLDASYFVKREKFYDYNDAAEFIYNDFNEHFNEDEENLLSKVNLYDDSTRNHVLSAIDKEFYHNPDIYYNMHMNEYEEGKYEYIVTTKEAYYNGCDTFDNINAFLMILLFLNCVICICWYCIRIYKKRTDV